MPREREPEPTAGLFEAGPGEKRIARILDKAVEKRIAASARSVPKTRIKLPGGAGKKAQKSLLGQALAKALGVRKGGKDKPSMRVKAKDTGGRSFHFEHTTVTKGQAYTASKRARNGATTKGMGTAKAHLAYIERETAVEKLRAIEERGRERELDVELLLDGPALDMPRKRGRPSLEDLKARAMVEAARDAALAKGFGREVEGGRERDPADIAPTLGGPGKGAAAQTYIEDPAKLRNGEVVLSSFGTIGETYEERLRFWGLVEEHERAPDARIQNRLICELPHQSTPEARKEILQRFVAIFDEKDIPYHVAVHAPGKGNDARNFHAHIVFLERPAKRIVDPATGELEWDFAIMGSYKTSSRNTIVNHPHRQKRDRDLNKQTFVADMRRKFATSVNEVMARIDPDVKFDPRSYKDMGVGVDPMESVYRISQNRLDQGKLVVQDVAWTRRMVAQKMREAALRRDPDMVRLQETTRALEALKASWPDVAAMNARLGPKARIANVASFTRRTLTQMVNHRLALENRRLQHAVVSRAEIEVCREVMEATRPRRERTRKKDTRTPEEQNELRVLFETASEEHDAVRARMRSEGFRLDALIVANKEAWNATARSLGPKAPRKPAPDKPDAVTCKIMFDPEFAVAARRADRPKKAKPMPGIAGEVPPAPKAMSRAAKSPLAAAPPRVATHAASEPSRPKAPGAALVRSAQDQARDQQKAATPNAAAHAAPGAFESAVRANMAAMVRQVAEQGLAFDLNTFWENARKGSPISADAVALAERTMQMPPGTFSAPPVEPIRAASEKNTAAPTETKQDVETLESQAATRRPATAVATPIQATPERPVPVWDLRPETGRAPADQAGEDATRPLTAKSRNVGERAPSIPIADLGAVPNHSQRAPAEAEPPIEMLRTPDVPPIVQNATAKSEKRAKAGATPSKQTHFPTSRESDVFATISEGEIEVTLSRLKPLSRKPSVNTIYHSELARGDTRVKEAAGDRAPMGAAASQKPAPNVSRTSEKPAAPAAFIPDYRDPEEETDEQKRKRKKADARRIAMQRRRGGTGLRAASTRDPQGR